jgi:hypothetical protein
VCSATSYNLPEYTMHQFAKIAAIAIVAVIIGKRVPIIKDYL